PTSSAVSSSVAGAAIVFPPRGVVAPLYSAPRGHASRRQPTAASLLRVPPSLVSAAVAFRESSELDLGADDLALRTVARFRRAPLALRTLARLTHAHRRVGVQELVDALQRRRERRPRLPLGDELGMR